jgi:hypothetical protein
MRAGLEAGQRTGTLAPNRNLPIIKNEPEQAVDTRDYEKPAGYDCLRIPHLGSGSSIWSFNQATRPYRAKVRIFHRVLKIRKQSHYQDSD